MLRFVSVALLTAMTLAFGQARLVSSQPGAIEIDYRLPDLTTSDVVLDGRTWQRVAFDGARFAPESGAPLVPHQRFTVAIPPGADISLRYQVNGRQTLSGIDLAPAVQVYSLRDHQLAIDASIYGSSAPWPGPIVEMGEPYTSRGMRFVDLTIHPVQFLPAARELQLATRLSITLQMRNARVSGVEARHTTEEKADLEATVLNYPAARAWGLPGASRLSRTVQNYDFTTGNWYQFPIEAEGVYRITGSTLSERGIDIAGVSIATIQLFNHGGDRLPLDITDPRPEGLSEIAIRVVDQDGDGTMDGNDEIYFYARDVSGWTYDRSSEDWVAYLNPYASRNTVLMTFNQTIGKRIPAAASPNDPAAVPVQRFRDRVRFEEDNFNILESGLDWYWQRFRDISQDVTLSLNLPQGIDGASATLNARVKGGSGAHYWDEPPFSNPYRYTFEVLVNGTKVDETTFINASSSSLDAPAPTLRAGDNQVQVLYGGNRDGCEAYLDYLELFFDRSLTAENGFLKIYDRIDTGTSAYTVSGLPGGSNWVWEITDYAGIREITPLQNGSTVRFQAAADNDTTARTFLVFAPSTARTVTGLQPVQASPNLRDAGRKGKLLIIAGDAFYDAAESWETFRETQQPDPIETERVRVSDIYREFSSGVPDPTAIRDFIRYAYQNWGGSDPDRFRPRYVLLMGDGSYDYRNIELTDYVNHVPVFEVTANTDIFSRATDNFFVAIGNDATSTGNLVPRLAIGRVPANSTRDVDNYLRKLQEYQQSYTLTPDDNGWQSTITLVADDECIGSNCTEIYHIESTEKVFRRIPTKFDVNKIYLTDYPTEAGGLGRTKPQASNDLLDQINRGTLIVNFFGHGDPNTWAHEQVLNKARDLPLINNGGKLPLWIAATCTWGKFDDPESPSMAEDMIWAESGGMGVIAATRPVYAFQNEAFVQSLFSALFHDRSETRRSRVIGDAMLRSLNGGVNDQKYHLFGDPSMRLVDPEAVVRIERYSADTLKALSTVSLDAVLEDSAGNPLTGFNGKALIRVFDAATELTQTVGSWSVDYAYTGGTIFKGVVSVVNGRIDNGSFIVPKSIKYRDARSGRISIYAWSETSGDAAGFVDTLLFMGSESQIADTDGPDIEVSFPDQPDFFDGDYIASQPTMRIRLSDVNGINLTGEVGHRIELTIDGTIKKDITEFFVYDENAYTRGEANYTLPALAPGRHTVQITAWDNLNNYSESQISFTTASATELSLQQVVNFPNPFTDDTHFTFQYQSPNGPGEASVKIYTVSGRLIQEITGLIARPGFNKIPWDGRDADGDLLANGVYIYKISVDDGDRTTERIEKLAIVR